MPRSEYGLQSIAVGVRSLCWLADQNHIGMFGEHSVILSGSGVLHREKLGVFGVLASSSFRDRYWYSIQLFEAGASCYRGRPFNLVQIIEGMFKLSPDHY